MRAAGVQWWSAPEAAARLADPSAADQLVEAAAVVVDLRGHAGDPPPGVGLLARAPCPVVALADAEPIPWPADVVLREGSPDTALLGTDAETAAGRLADAAGTAPGAAGVLAQLLRATAGLPAADALAAESLAYSLLLGGPEFRDWLDRHRSTRGPAGSAGGAADAVLVDRDGDVLQLTLNRPHVHNAYDTAMRDGLVAGLHVASVDPAVHRVVIRGNGPSFCSGGDLDEFGTAANLVAAHRVRTSRSAALLVHRLRERVEVRVHGACVGAGVELPAFAGHVVATPDATFRLPEVGMGALPGAGGTVSLPRRVGRERTLLLALSGLALPAGDALRWGLVDAVTA